MKKQNIKLIALIKTHRSCRTLWVGTLAQMTDAFSYTLECGNSMNERIKTAREIKTLKGLVSNLNKSVKETQGSCYNRDFYEEAIVTDEAREAWTKQQETYQGTYTKDLED